MNQECDINWSSFLGKCIENDLGIDNVDGCPNWQVSRLTPKKLSKIIIDKNTMNWIFQIHQNLFLLSHRKIFGGMYIQVARVYAILTFMTSIVVDLMGTAIHHS